MLTLLNRFVGEHRGTERAGDDLVIGTQQFHIDVRAAMVTVTAIPLRLAWAMSIHKVQVGARVPPEQHALTVYRIGRSAGSGCAVDIHGSGSVLLVCIPSVHGAGAVAQPTWDPNHVIATRRVRWG